MTINLRDNKLILTFKYDPVLIAAVRKIPGRQWNLNLKRWEVPVENAVECVDLLAPFGMNPTIEARRAYDEQKAQYAMAEDIKAQPPQETSYNGNLPLFPFQRTGVAFLRSMPHSLLADAPGLGKTIQTIGACEGQIGVKAIFAPSSLKFQWESEIYKWRPNEKVFVVDGNKKQRDEIYRSAKDHGNCWLIMNYELLLRDFDMLKVF